MCIAKRLEIKEFHQRVRWNAEAMVRIELEERDLKMIKRSEVRKLLAHWLTEFHRLQVN